MGCLWTPRGLDKTSLVRGYQALTDSDHYYRKYPNCVKNLIPERPNEMWTIRRAVSDLTYFLLGSNFAYLTVVMDAYSRKIVGWSLQRILEAKGSLQALDMALVQRGKCGQSLVHHRGGDPV